MVKHSFIIPLLLLASSSVLAQVCDPSNATGQCGFRDANGNLVRSAEEVYSSYQQQNRTTYTPPPPPITVMLPDRFGAIALNSTTFASTYNMSSKKEARQKALQDCQYGQKQPCRIFTEYANGCVSFVQGWKGKLSTFMSEGSPERGHAYYNVMSKCFANHDTCTVLIKEECSIAEPPR